MTRLPIASLVALVAYLIPLAAFVAPAHAAVPAQALVQLHLSGEIAAPSTVTADETSAQPAEFHGHLVELEVEAVGREPGTELVLHLHVAQGTTGRELLQLAATRLDRLGIDATLTGVTAKGGDHTAGSLWIEGATRVRLRLGGGIVGEVSCTEGPPAAIRLLAPSAILPSAEQPSEALVAASTAIVMKGRPPIRGRATFKAALAEAKHSADAATALWEAASKGWMSDRPGSDTWRPVKMTNGAAITGVSVRVVGQADWGVEVTL